MDWPTMSERIISISKMLNNLDLDAKNFIHNYLFSNNSDIKSQHQYWRTATGWTSTERLLLTIGQLVILDSIGGLER
ncbi:hypothetical protein CROQUDRAFT_37668 [Cronartium quercuum f. sp. fusiforme G11]|uniref:Uncharacterized protein n=1 Tax=Cronartium quercuum f. sp. fusiforme G11 TaxID=708437 RepID=A0A9P6NRU8_9BASI|nr:hypothetical protein CROQUDRAFT_37668 [Cronartium quercuum f. sp. fusiforme G11]